MEKISPRQLTLMGTGMTFNATLISLPAQLAGVAKQNAWIVYPVTAATILLSIWALARVSARFPSHDLMGSLIERHPLAGRLIALILIAFFYVVLVRDLRMIIDFTNITLLPSTPLSVIGILFIITIISIARGGTEMLARMTDLFFIPLCFVILSLPLLLGKEVQLHFLKPVLDEGVMPILTGVWYTFPYIGEVLIIPFLFTGKTFRFKFGLHALLFGTLLLEILLVLNLTVLGTHLTGRFMYPNHELVRQIRITDFLDRFDLILVAIYLPAITTKIAFGLYFVCHVLKQMMPTLSARALVAPAGLFSLVASFWFFENSIQLLNFNRTWPLLSIVPIYVIPLLLLLFVRPKKKKEEEGSEKEEEKKEAS